VRAEPLPVTAGDPYPSRRADRPAILRRLDPCVYAAPGSSGPLTAKQLASYAERGYLVLEGLFDDGEIATLKEESERLRAHAATLAAETLIHEPDGEELRSIFRIHAQSELMAGLAADARLLAIARQLLGDEVYLHQSRLNLKPGFDGREFYWHSDFETWHVEDGMPRMRASSMSIALDENTACNGPLMLIPGSHRHFVSCVGATPREHYRQSLRRQAYGVPDRASLAWLVERGGIDLALGSPGAVVVFDCNTMHGSSGNLTPWPRSNVFLVYNSRENRLQAPYGGLPPRPEFIAAREVVTTASTGRPETRRQPA
jgi:ectoine hydroxylase